MLGIKKETPTASTSKCPSCGAALPIGAKECEFCGYDVSVNGTTPSKEMREGSGIQRLTEEIKQYEADRDKLFRGKNTDAKIANAIRQSRVPDEPEEMLEMMLLANMNINAKGDGAQENSVLKAWRAKMDQIYQKARISNLSTAEFQKIDSIYQELLQKEQAEKKKCDCTF